MDAKRKQYKRTWMAAFRKVAVARSTELLQTDNSSRDQDEFDNRFRNEDMAAENLENETSTVDVALDTASKLAEFSAETASDVRHCSWFDCNEYESCSSSDADCESFDDGMLSDNLAVWASEFGVKQNAIDKLLKILQMAGHRVPSSARSLLKTTRHVTVSEISGMQYVYLGINKQVQKFAMAIPENVLASVHELEISLNIDGLPLFKSSNTCVWPVLCAVVNVQPVTVFPVALASGPTKPCNLDFLDDTVRDLSHLLKSGVTVGNRNLKLNLRCIICDAPARAMVKAVKLYSGYEGCDKCTQRGKWIGRMTYPEVSNLELRTDESFRQQSQIGHHHETPPSPFCELPIDLIKTFPIDYMHQSCLGVMRKLLMTWLKGKPDVRISAGQAHIISEKLIALRRFVPKLFARRPRSLAEVDRWKATEFRLFLLYFGKLVLKGVISEDLYENFMTLSVAISILVSPSLAITYNSYAHELLVHFVMRCRQLYGDEFLVYNVHSMVHIAAEAQQFGSLDNCSSFNFENYLQIMKRMVRSGRNPLTQIVKRLSESSFINVIQHSEPVFCTKPPNNAYIMDNAVCCEVINSAIKADTEEASKSFLCRLYTKTQPLFSIPCDSRIMGTYVVQSRYSSIAEVQRDKLKTRAIMVEAHGPGSHCFMAILHDT